MRVAYVGRQVREAIGFHDYDNWYRGVRAEDGHEGIDIFRHVLFKPIRTIALRIVITRAISILGTADLAIRRLRVTIAVRQVVPDNSDKRRRGLGSRIL